MKTLKKNRPFTFIKTAISLDGYIDDLSPTRLILSNEADKNAVDELKSTFDAILIGAETVRKDNPSLLIKSPENRQKRLEKCLNEHPIKVTLTLSGNLDVQSRFFQEGDVEKIVYCPMNLKNDLEKKLGHIATVVGLLPNDNVILNPVTLLEDLYKRGMKRLMIEGGGKINTLFLEHGLIDAMRIAVAPFFVGETNAPKFTLPTSYPHNKNNRMKLEKSEILDDMVILNFQL